VGVGERQGGRANGEGGLKEGIDEWRGRRGWMERGGGRDGGEA
jgi:hypothetical protein